MNTPYQEPSALQTPRLFRRSTGAHAILAAVLGADLVETVVLVLIGGLAGPVLAWLLHAILGWMHGSLLGAIGLILLLALCVYALITRLTTKASFTDTWGCAATGAIPIVSLFLILWLIKPDWIAIHTSVIPAQAPGPFP